MKNRKGLKDPESVAAMEITAMERQNEELAKLQLKKREGAIANVFEAAGKIKGMQLMETQSEFFKLALLKQIKEAKSYRDEFGMTWQQFCDMVGVKRRTIDEQLEDLKPFNDEFFSAFRQFSGVDFNKIKHLGIAITGGLAKIEGDKLVYNGEAIPLTPDDIQGVLDKIQEDLGKRADEAEANLKAAKRNLRDKDALLEKKNKEIDRYTGKARSQDLTPEEDGFLARMEQHRIGFDGYMLGAEPTRMAELVDDATTPRMRAAYIETLGYMRRQIIAAYDTAVEMYGHDMEVAR